MKENKYLKNYWIKVIVGNIVLIVIGALSIILCKLTEGKIYQSGILVIMMILLVLNCSYLYFLSYMKKVASGKRLSMLPIVLTALIALATLIVLYILLIG